MVDCTRSIFSQSQQPAAAYLAISLLRPSGEKKQTFSAVSLQLTVKLPCLQVFSSFILPSRACQKRSFDDVSTVTSGAKGGVKLDKRTDHRKALDRRRFERDCPGPRPDQRRFVVYSPRSWSELRELVEVWSSPMGAFAARTGAFAARTRKGDIFLSNHRQFRSNFAWARSWA